MFSPSAGLFDACRPNGCEWKIIGSADPATPDASYAMEAAVIEGYEFDRVAFRVVAARSARRIPRIGLRWMLPRKRWPTRVFPMAAVCRGIFTGSACRQHAHGRVLAGERDATAVAVRAKSNGVRARQRWMGCRKDARLS